jgi:NADPH:quinone reductase-like Zn-dependent oxidoreductase
MVDRGGALIVFGLSAVATKGLRAALGTIGTLLSLWLFRVLPGKRSALFAIDQAYHRDPARVRGWVERVMAMLAAGTIAPLVGATLPLAEVAEAHRLVETGQIVGKVVIDCR